MPEAFIRSAFIWSFTVDTVWLFYWLYCLSLTLSNVKLLLTYEDKSAIKLLYNENS